MKNRLWFAKFSILSAAWLCFAGVGRAQDAQAPQGADKPKPAAKTYGPIGGEDQDQDQTPAETLQPDERPLTGIQQPTVGTPLERHSYWVPGVSYYNFIDSNGSSQGGGSDWNSTSYLSGNVSLLENWSRSQLALNFSGGGYFSSDSRSGNGGLAQLGAVQTFNRERWQLTFLDQFAYLPSSQFGFGAGTGLAAPGIGGTLGVGSTGIGGQFDPGQSIFTAVGPRYTNTFGTQMNYVLTPRASLTFGGIVSMLRFTESGNIESNNYIGNVGYNYQINREDTIGLQYHFSSFHYLGSAQAIGDHSIQAVYGKKITGRLALQLAGGPEITHYRIPIGGGTNTQHLSGSGTATLSYAFARGSVSLGYLHGLTSGSGVFVGATADQLTASGSRRLSRVWSGDAHLGFAHNRQATTAQGLASPSYNTVYAGGSAARPLGRNASFSLGYTARNWHSVRVGVPLTPRRTLCCNLGWPDLAPSSPGDCAQIRDAHLRSTRGKAFSIQTLSADLQLPRQTRRFRTSVRADNLAKRFLARMHSSMSQCLILTRVAYLSHHRAESDSA